VGRIREETKVTYLHIGVTLMLDISAVTLWKLHLAATAIVTITVNNYNNYKTNKLDFSNPYWLGKSLRVMFNDIPRKHPSLRFGGRWNLGQVQKVRFLKIPLLMNFNFC
jgi:hypothetical protein